MDERFRRAVEVVLKHEGGYVNDPFCGARGGVSGGPPQPLQGIAERIKGFFPQSPAKDGPLTDYSTVMKGGMHER